LFELNLIHLRKGMLTHCVVTIKLHYFLNDFECFYSFFFFFFWKIKKPNKTKQIRCSPPCSGSYCKTATGYPPICCSSSSYVFFFFFCIRHIAVACFQMPSLLCYFSIYVLDFLFFMFVSFDFDFIIFKKRKLWWFLLYKQFLL
jgi:hypothetical protein